MQIIYGKRKSGAEVGQIIHSKPIQIINFPLVEERSNGDNRKKITCKGVFDRLKLGWYQRWISQEITG